MFGWRVHVHMLFGSRCVSPEISRQRIQPKKLRLPEPSQFGQLVQAIRDAKGRYSEGCGHKA